MDIESLGSALGSSKVNLNIQSSSTFAQGMPITGKQTEFVNLFDLIGKQNIEMNDFIDREGYVFPSRAKGNTFIMLLLHLIDQKTSLLKLSDALNALTSFKIDLSKNLDNEKQLWKKFGFHRKRTLNLEKVKSDLTSEHTDSILGHEHYLYFAKLVGMEFIVVNYATLERFAYNEGAPVSYMFRKFDNNEYGLYSLQGTFNEKLDTDLKTLPIWDELNKKASGKKKLAKFTQIST